MFNIIPETLGDLSQERDLRGLKIIKCYYLEFDNDHNPKNPLLPVLKRTGNMVVCCNEVILQEVKKLLPAISHKQLACHLLADLQDNYGFDATTLNRNDTPIWHIIDELKLKQLLNSDPQPFVLSDKVFEHNINITTSSLR